MCGRGSYPFLKRKLTIFALGLYFSAIFLPWLLEDYSIPRGFRREIKGTMTNWSFMTNHNDNWLYFQNFWFAGSPPPWLYWMYGPIFVGLYVGWFLLFALQVLVAMFCFSYWFKRMWLLRGWEATAILASTFVAVLVGVFQFIVQYDIFYKSMGEHGVKFHLGFWIAFTSSVLLTISYWRSPEREQIKRFCPSLRRSWKSSLVIVLIFTSTFFLVNEFQSQTYVAKRMVVEKRLKPGSIPADPKLWESYSRTIITIAGFFRAKVTSNYPEYLFLVLEVPVISYRVLMTIYNSIGFIASEDEPASF